MGRKNKNKNKNPGAAIKKMIEEKKKEDPPPRRGRSRERRSPSYSSYDSRESVNDELDVEAVFSVINSAKCWREIVFSTTLFEMGLMADHLDWLREVWCFIEDDRRSLAEEEKEAKGDKEVELEEILPVE